MVPTSRGPMPWAALSRAVTIRENDDVCVIGYEFYFEGEQVHRSAHVMMKRWPSSARAEVGRLV